MTAPKSPMTPEQLADLVARGRAGTLEPEELADLVAQGRAAVEGLSEIVTALAIWLRSESGQARRNR